MQHVLMTIELKACFILYTIYIFKSRMYAYIHIIQALPRLVPVTYIHRCEFLDNKVQQLCSLRKYFV